MSAIKEFLMYLKMERGATEMTLISYDHDYRPFIKFAQRKGLMDIKDVTTLLLRTYFVEMQQAYHYKVNTICRRVNTLRSFFLYCQNQEYIVSNPMTKITTPKREKPLPIYLTDDEARKFIETPSRHQLPWVRKRDKAVVDMLFYTGIRRNELINLDTQDVNMDEWILKVRKGKGNKDRLIPLNAPLFNSLKEYLAVKPSKHPALFVSINHSRRIGKNGLYELFKKHLKYAKISRPGITIHKIRHTFATMVLKGSKDLIAVQELLGHSDLSSTRIYLHTTMDDLRRAVDKHPLG